jgi:hypothetical protein
MIKPIIFALIFGLLFNWSVNLHILARVEKELRTKVLAMSISFIVAVVTGLFIYGFS